MGDSGSPLWTTDESGHAVVIGVVSRADDICANVNRTAIYVRVKKFLGWIEENMKGKLC